MLFLPIAAEGGRLPVKWCDRLYAWNLSGPAMVRALHAPLGQRCSNTYLGVEFRRPGCCKSFFDSWSVVHKSM